MSDAHNKKVLEILFIFFVFVSIKKDLFTEYFFFADQNPFDVIFAPFREIVVGDLPRDFGSARGHLLDSYAVSILGVRFHRDLLHHIFVLYRRSNSINILKQGFTSFGLEYLTRIIPKTF